jgi:hypothetical protein
MEHSARRPIANWNPSRDLWESEQDDLFSEHLVEFSETFPSSGSMRSGRLYVRATSGPLTVAPESSLLEYLLPTPRVSMQHGPSQREIDEGNPKRRLETEVELLPTPTASNQNSGKQRNGTGGPSLEEVTSLLPTPRATDGTKGGPNQRGSSGDQMLPSAVQDLLPTPRATRGGSHTETMSLLPTPGVAGGGKKIPEGAKWSGKAAYKPDGTKIQVHLDRIDMLLSTPMDSDELWDN